MTLFRNWIQNWMRSFRGLSIPRALFVILSTFILWQTAVSTITEYKKAQEITSTNGLLFGDISPDAMGYFLKISPELFQFNVYNDLEINGGSIFSVSFAGPDKRTIFIEATEGREQLLSNVSFNDIYDNEIISNYSLKLKGLNSLNNKTDDPFTIEGYLLITPNGFTKFLLLFASWVFVIATLELCKKTFYRDD